MGIWIYGIKAIPPESLRCLDVAYPTQELAQEAIEELKKTEINTVWEIKLIWLENTSTLVQEKAS